MDQNTPLKLGCLPAKRDARNFRMAELLVTPKKPPRTYNFDKKYPDMPFPMLANDRHGCCVITARGVQTLRMEAVEQGRIIPVSDQDVIREWRRQNGNTEDGLYILDSLGLWRKQGWIVGGHPYRIKAFAEVDRSNLDEVKRVSAAQIGLQLGLAMPDNWGKEFAAGKPWSDTSKPPNEYNGHCVLAGFSYDTKYLYCHTWARKQPMTWKWFSKYCTEAYGTIDAANEHNIDLVALDEMLQNVRPVRS